MTLRELQPSIDAGYEDLETLATKNQAKMEDLIEGRFVRGVEFENERIRPNLRPLLPAYLGEIAAAVCGGLAEEDDKQRVSRAANLGIFIAGKLDHPKDPGLSFRPSLKDSNYSVFRDQLNTMSFGYLNERPTLRSLLGQYMAYELRNLSTDDRTAMRIANGFTLLQIEDYRHEQFVMSKFMGQLGEWQGFLPDSE
jgi:hypothetical protein